MIKAFHSVMTKILAAALSLTAICCVAGCAGEKPAEENVEISLNKTEIEIYEGETFRLTVTVTPADAQDKRVEWRTSDAAIATVEEGLVTGKKAGETTVTARTNEKTVECKVTVKAKEGSSDSSSDSSSSESASDSSSSESTESSGENPDGGENSTENGGQE